MFSKLINASVLIVLLICFSCDEKLDAPITPSSSPTLNQLILGTWKFQSATGTATVANKKIDLVNDLELTDKTGTTRTIKKTVAWVFNENGTGIQDGEAFTYKITGKTMSITKANITFTLNVSINNNQLEITETETGIKSIIDEYNALLLSSNTISNYTRTQSYKSLKEILSTNGTPSCLVKGFTTITATGKEITEIFYNDEKKMVSLIINYTDLSGNAIASRKVRFEEERSNFGSDTKPSIKHFINNQFYGNYYCDKNGRINRMELFNRYNDKYPTFVLLDEYDSNNNNSKTTYLTYDGLTGKKVYFESFSQLEYLNGNTSKMFTTTSYDPKYLSYEVTAWTPELRKTKVGKLYSHGLTNNEYDQKNHPLKCTWYDRKGEITEQCTYAYTFDSKGYILTEKKQSADGLKTISTTTYEYYSCN